jgi:hypothetical protein
MNNLVIKPTLANLRLIAYAIVVLFIGAIAVGLTVR